jgi:hypothetical protein
MNLRFSFLVISVICFDFPCRLRIVAQVRNLLLANIIEVSKPPTPLELPVTTATSFSCVIYSWLDTNYIESNLLSK